MKEDILREALEEAVKDINKLWNRLNKGVYIPYTAEDYIASVSTNKEGD